MWPFDASIESLWLVLYLLSFALHAVFVGYVAAGTVYALVAAVRGSADPIAARARDWLPFLLGAGITAGVGPLLFLQLLYQRRFYTANLLMGPRWGAVVPALIVGFYALYLAKASEHRRRIALGVGAVCFGFVAWSWTELHQVMLDDAGWRAMYGAGERFHLDGAIIPRLVTWAGAMLALFATVAAWQVPAAAATATARTTSTTHNERRSLAGLGLAGMFIGGLGCVAAIITSGTGGFDAAHGWTYVLIAAAIAAAIGWALALRRPDGRGLAIATIATTVALLAGTIVREAPRLAVLERSRATAVDAGGLPIFLLTLVIGIAAILWVVRTVRSAVS